MDHFTADPHIGHEAIIGHCKRPFTSAEEMDEQMIERWNAVVAPDDTVWIIGDVALGCSVEYAIDKIQRRNGKKRVLLGNHDDMLPKLTRIAPRLFEHVYANQIQEVKINGQKIVMCHYAMRSWHHDLRGNWHLFGHTHSLLPPFGKSMDVGVDAWSFYPVGFDKVKDVMDSLPVGPHPGFERYFPKEKA